MKLTLSDPPFPSIESVPTRIARPFWSVVIPIYNRTRYLPDCLRSVLDQDPGPDQLEIIVQDDCSTEDIGPVVEAHGRGRIQHVRNDRNLGLYGNTNAGLARTTGSWIHVLHDDDWVQPGFYAAMRSAIEGAPGDVGVCCCRYTNHHEPEGTTWSPQPFLPQAGRLDGWVFHIAVSNPLNIPAVVVKREVHERIGGYVSALSYTADWEFYIRSAARYPWWYIPDNLACYRVHPANLTKDLWNSGEAAANLRLTIELAETYLPEAVRRRSLPIARLRNAKRSLQQAARAAKANLNDAAWTLIQESLKLCGEPAIVAEAFALLATPELAEVRTKLALVLAGVELGDRR